MFGAWADGDDGEDLLGQENFFTNRGFVVDDQLGRGRGYVEVAMRLPFAEVVAIDSLEDQKLTVSQFCGDTLGELLSASRALETSA